MESIFMVVLIAAVYVSVRQPRQYDLMFDRPRPQPLFDNSDVADAFATGMADTANPGSLTDADVHRLIGEIVNNDITNDDKYYLLDALYLRARNDHIDGMAAHVLETILDESIALTHPEWHGRHGTFVSMRQ